MTCHCINVDVGTYDNQVSMKNPYGTHLDGWVSIDTCIATEIGWLWNQGIHTLNSCCGHKKFLGWVIVEEEFYQVMHDHGYGWFLSSGGLRCWNLFTGTTGRQLLS